MGTWSVDSFGNDNACDWTYGLAGCNNLSLVEKTLDTVLTKGAKYLESTEACEALVAIEAIARLQGNWGDRDSYSEPVDSWVEKLGIVPSKALAEKAQRVIERILADESELKELWEDSDEFDAWQSSVKNLADRVNV